METTEAEGLDLSQQTMQPPTLSLKHLATELGFSKSTVSRALRGLSRMSEKTRQEIVERAEKLGYKPDPVVANVMASFRGRQVRDRQFELIPVLTDPKSFKQLREEEQAINEAILKDMGVKIEYFDVSTKDAKSWGEMFQNRGVRLILLAIHFDADLLSKNIPTDGLVVVNTAVNSELDGIDEVHLDLAHAAEKLNAALLLLNCTHTGVVIPGSSPPSHIAAYSDTIQQANLSYHYLADSSESGSGTAMRINEWAKSNQLDSVIFHSPSSQDLVEDFIEIRDSLQVLAVGNGDSLSGVRIDFKSAWLNAIETLRSNLARDRYAFSKNPTSLSIRGSWRWGKGTDHGSRLPAVNRSGC